MADLRSSYMGLSLDNPLVASSSPLTASKGTIEKLTNVGIGALVLKSLFEEQIEGTIDEENQGDDYYAHPEASEYLQGLGKFHGSASYLEFVSTIKKQVSVPVIASLNAVSTKWWSNYAVQLQEAGADGLELNIGLLPITTGEKSGDIEKRIVAIVDKVRNKVNLPLAVKLGAHYTSLPNLCSEIRKAGADALVLFNRFYAIDFDIENMSLSAGMGQSSPEEFGTTLRWISLLYKQIGCELAASTGIHDGSQVIKSILAGASVTQVYTGLVKHGFDHIKTMKDQLARFMDSKGLATIDQMRGMLSRDKAEDVEQYNRLQYIKALSGIKE